MTLKPGRPWTKKDELLSIESSHSVYYDKYPVTEGHMLFVPEDLNDMRLTFRCFERAYMYGKHKVDTGIWDGFNIGMNWGEAAGQTVEWPHVHLIPRRKGDMEDPRGGVRGVIPEKQKY